MYGIFTYIWLIFMVHVGKYTSPHASHGYGCPPNKKNLWQTRIACWKNSMHIPGRRNIKMRWILQPAMFPYRRVTIKLHSFTYHPGHHPPRVGETPNWWWKVSGEFLPNLLIIEVQELFHDLPKKIIDSSDPRNTDRSQMSSNQNPGSFAVFRGILGGSSHLVSGQ